MAPANLKYMGVELMGISDWINVVLCILSFLLALISVITVVITLRQNHQMIENSTRPYIVITYERIIVPHGIARYIVVKNYGQTGAKITSMSLSGDIPEEFEIQFSKVSGAFLAPSQRLLYYFGGINLGSPERILFSYEYESGKKKYKETTELTLINGASSTGPESDDAVKYALQDIAERLI